MRQDGSASTLGPSQERFRRAPPTCLFSTSSPSGVFGRVVTNGSGSWVEKGNLLATGESNSPIGLLGVAGLSIPCRGKSLTALLLPCSDMQNHMGVGGIVFDPPPLIDIHPGFNGFI